MKKIGLYLVIGWVGLGAQTAVRGGPPKPDMDERTLQEKYHIAANEEGLIGALQHQDQAVRDFAAIRLANDGDKVAIRPILDALSAEKVDGVRIIQAASAARLGSTEGFDALKSMCEDQTWSPTMRMVAAQTMINVVGHQECLADVLDVLRSQPEDHQASSMALNLLTFNRFRQIPPNQADEIRNLCANYLKSPASELRMAAGGCIRDQGGPWAISQLRAAIDAEGEQAVRNSLEKDLLSVH
ncbi:MAG TPA: HEAT repeat domain-containing protein [Bryobacteraceae bacterium]|jgi:hypothetical protein|nr:HEAT repeat domain-containing protein [Bryobacteraceae bacterium]